MVRSFIEMILGEYGRQILYFYEANACLINSIVVTYGLFMLLAWNNLVRSYRFLIVELAKSIHLSEELNRKSTNKQVRETVEVPWESAVKASPFPFVARIGALIPKRMKNEVLQELFDEKDLTDKAIRLLKGENIRRMSPSTRKIMDREMAARKEAANKKQPLE